MASSLDITIGTKVTFQLNGRTVEGWVAGHEQAGKHRGKWIVQRDGTVRAVRRTSRQLTVVLNA